MTTLENNTGAHICDRTIGRIPVRNLWLLMLYASDLTRICEAQSVAVDADINDIPDLVARLLADAVEYRLRRNLTRGYRCQAKALTRVRGRIDVLRTECRQLLSRGEVFCQYEDLTFDTPRNRLVRAALDVMARLVADTARSQKCRSLAATLGRAGVGGSRPSRAELASDQIGRNDASDRFMITLARLAFDLALPTEEAGAMALAAPGREEAWVRRLFQKAVFGFAAMELRPRGWSVRAGVHLNWQLTAGSSGIGSIMPGMETDIVLDSPDGARTVVDTKFTSVVARGRFGHDVLKSSHIYQIYAYLRSQEGLDRRWDTASALLLHPVLDRGLREEVEIQGHRVRFATVDLTCAATEIRNELREVLGRA